MCVVGSSIFADAHPALCRLLVLPRDLSPLWRNGVVVHVVRFVLVLPIERLL